MGMVFRAFHYMPPTNISMRMLARLLYEADARVFPFDNAFRDIAKSRFEKRNLWDSHLVLTAPPIGSEVQKVAYDRPEALARVVMTHADQSPDSIGNWCSIINTEANHLKP